MAQIHPTAIVEDGAQLGADVTVGAYSIIHKDVQLGDGSIIGSHCEIGVPTPRAKDKKLVIGNGAHIRSHSVFYAGSTFGEGLVTGHRVCVREGTQAGAHLQIGTASEIQGDCTLGECVRMQSNIFIAQKSVVGNYVWLLPYAMLTNDPTPPSDDWEGCVIADYATISARAVIMPGVTVGTHALVAASACVTKDVPPHMLVAGVPAKVLKRVEEITRKGGAEGAAYPWPTHFTRGYPEAVTAAWRKEFGSDD